MMFGFAEIAGSYGTGLVLIDNQVDVKRATHR
jgi:hypothetical protein